MHRFASAGISTIGWLLAFAADAQENSKPLPKVDPMALTSCDVADGWIVVSADFKLKLDQAMEAGRIDQATFAQIAAWSVGQDNYILATADVKKVCRETIALRKQHGF